MCSSSFHHSKHFQLQKRTNGRHIKDRTCLATTFYLVFEALLERGKDLQDFNTFMGKTDYLKIATTTGTIKLAANQTFEETGRIRK